MKSLLAAVAAGLAFAGTAFAQTPASTDPVVQSRAKLNDAGRSQDVATGAASKELSQAKARANAELAADKKGNAALAEKAQAEGKDGLVVRRELDAKSTAAYKDKLKTAQASYASAKQAAVGKMDATKAVEFSKIEKQIKP